MALIRLIASFLICQFVHLCSSASVRVYFEKCDTKGFYCYTSNEVVNKSHVLYECSNARGQDITFYLWGFNSPANITAVTIQNCNTLRLSFTCSGENKPIQWLKLINIKYLEILQPTVAHNPPRIYLQNVEYVKTLPRDTFVQIKKTVLKPGCFVPLNDLSEVFFENVNIGTIETEAFKNLTNMKNFSWSNVSVKKINLNAIHLSFEDGARGTMNKCNLDVVEPMGMRVTGDGFSIKNGIIGNLWGRGINGTIYDFEFSSNTVANMQSGAISVSSLKVQMTFNNFQNIESGAFQKITPGLLYDSERDLGQLMFSYEFRNNTIQSIKNGGIKPNIDSYKNVAAEITYAYNTLECSCEGLTWFGADVDLGYGYSVLKDFKTMILNSPKNNACGFTPCMCFGVKPPYKRSTAAASGF